MAEVEERKVIWQEVSEPGWKEDIRLGCLFASEALHEQGMYLLDVDARPENWKLISFMPDSEENGRR